MNTKDKLALIKDLRSYDHAFIGEVGCRRFLDPFGIKGGVQTWKADGDRDPKGLTLNDGANEAVGQDAAIVAELIAYELDCIYFRASGRGSRLRYACDAIEAKLNELDPDFDADQVAGHTDGQSVQEKMKRS